MSRHRVVTAAFVVLLTGMLVLYGPLLIPPHWLITLIAAYIAMTVYGTTVLAMQYFLPAYVSGPRTMQAIALTFDDGPLPGKTDRILNILKEHNVRATFFCIGARAEASHELLKRISDEGHLIGNHSYHHGKLFDLQSSRSMLKELTMTDEVVRKVTGNTPQFFRPPYGVTNPMVANAVRQGNYLVVGWSIRSMDTMVRDKDKLLRNLTSRIKAGDIILLHDYSESMIEMLPALITHVQKTGLKIVRTDVLLNQQGYVEQ